jgi:hypothetical protein
MTALRAGLVAALLVHAVGVFLTSLMEYKMDNFPRIVGLILIGVGFYALVSLAANFEDIIFNFKNSQLHNFVMENIGDNFIVKYGDKDIVISQGVFNFMSLLFGFLFLNIWLKIGVAMMKAGGQLASTDINAVSKKIDDLKNRIKEMQEHRKS